jgi:hypothetical protein
MNQHRGDNWAWGITFALWFAGMVPLTLLWNAHPFGAGTADEVYGFGLYLVAFFYFLALIPLRRRVELGLKAKR